MREEGHQKIPDARFGHFVKDALQSIVSEIEPSPDGLDEILSAIRRHRMPMDYNISITEREDSPDDWPIRSIEITVTAKDDEEAEELADKLITLIQADRNVTAAMQINEVYEV
jgi:uncharacterized protein YlxP (DUF503 family)